MGATRMGTPAETYLALGLMSGTSADGMDAALIRTDGESLVQPLGGTTIPYEATFRQSLLQLATRDVPLVEVLRVEQHLTQLHAQAVHAACRLSGTLLHDVDIVGFHGHTIRHLPAARLSWQMGNGSLLAQLVGRPVVCHFRQADLAAGGEGAPLAPLYHHALMSRAATAGRGMPQMVLNLGGVANLTWFDDSRIIAGDCGPGCGLIDAWVEQHTGDRMDRDGALAGAGRIHEDLVRAATDGLDFFQRPLPKSADRFDFDDVDVSRLSLEDGAATLCALTVRGVTQAVSQLPQRPQQVWITGGGARHPLMMSLLRKALGNVEPISHAGHDPDLLEAACFAWLAVRRLRGLPTSLPTTTGARVATCGGQLALA